MESVRIELYWSEPNVHLRGHDTPVPWKLEQGDGSYTDWRFDLCTRSRSYNRNLPGEICLERSNKNNVNMSTLKSLFWCQAYLKGHCVDPWSDQIMETPSYLPSNLKDWSSPILRSARLRMAKEKDRLREASCDLETEVERLFGRSLLLHSISSFGQ